MVVKIPLYLTTHTRKIAILYKKWLRHIEGGCDNRAQYRFKAALARAEFDIILNEKDLRRSKELLVDKELYFSKNFINEPIYFPSSPKGVAYNRDTLIEDWVLDLWHPLEKAQYPKYFAKRELRKQQYIQWWEKMHGPPPPCDEY